MSPSSGSGRRLKPSALLACVTAPLLVLLVLQGARNWGSGGVALARIELFIVVVLLLSAAGVERASRHVQDRDPAVGALLLFGCTIAVAVGNRPGAVVATLPGMFTAAALMAFAFALLGGIRGGRSASALIASSIVFAFATGTAWQVAGASFVARLVIG